jgi:hypothetical protein
VRLFAVRLVADRILWTLTLPRGPGFSGSFARAAKSAAPRQLRPLRVPGFCFSGFPHS